MRSILGCFIVITVIMTSQTFAGNFYYVDGTNGDDLNGGLSPDASWKTINKANNTLTAGDTVYIRTGTYNQPIDPRSSGSSENYITYENYPGEEPNITGIATSYGACIDGYYYIRIKGLRMDNGSQSGHNMQIFVRIKNSDHCIVEDCIFKYLRANGISTWNYGIWIEEESNYAHIKGNSIEYVGKAQPPATNDTGDGIQICGDYALVEDNYINYCGHQGIGVLYTANYTVVRNNTIRGTWGRPINDHGQDTVMDGNIIYDVNKDDDLGNPNHAVQYEGNDNTIFRRNVVYDSDGPGILSYATAGLQESSGVRSYNNTVYNSGREQVENHNASVELEEYGGTYYMSDYDWRNNIFYNCDFDGFYYDLISSPNDHNTTHNHWVSDGGDSWDSEYDTYGDPNLLMKVEEIFILPQTVLA